MNTFQASMKIGLKLVTDTIQLTNDQKYFAIKGECLYWYANERSRTAEKQILLRDVKSIDRDEKQPKWFYFFHEKKCYKLEAENEIACEKWVNSLRLVLEQAQVDVNDLNRYKNQEIFNKVTGKSLYKPLDQLIQEEATILQAVVDEKTQEFISKITPKNLRVQEEEPSGIQRTRTGMGSFFGKAALNQNQQKGTVKFSQNN